MSAVTGGPGGLARSRRIEYESDMRILLKTRPQSAGFLLLFGLLFFAQAPALSGAAELGKTTILALGDSLTEGYELKKSDAYPALLEARLNRSERQPIRIINAGVSGATTAGSRERLAWYLKTPHTVPQILLLALGANDGLRGLDPKKAEENLRATIQLAQKSGVLVLLVGMKVPPNYGTLYSARFEKIFSALSQEFRLPFVPFLLEGVAGDPALNLPDGIHPNEKGHQKIAAHLEPHVKKALSLLKEKSQ